MFKKFVIVGVLAGAVAFVGCGKSFNCENIAERNKKCSDELVAQFMKQMPDMPKAFKTKLKKKLKKEFAGKKFKTKCEKAWKSSKKKDKEMKKKMKECWGKSGCEAYAKCLAKTMK